MVVAGHQTPRADTIKVVAIQIARAIALSAMNTLRQQMQRQR